MANPTPVGGTTASSSTTVTSLTLTYSATVNNQVVVGVQFSTATTPTGIAVKDNNGNALTAGTILGSLHLFYGTVVGSPTSYKVTWATADRVAAVLEEYNGGSGFTAGTTNSGTSANPNVVTSVTHPNTTVVAIFGSVLIVTFSTQAGQGTVRQTVDETNTSPASAGLADNTGTGSVTVGANSGSSFTVWNAISLQLFAPAASNLLMMVGCGT